jgi:3'(2'), 5'-bisphosphate nucleotidase
MYISPLELYEMIYLARYPQDHAPGVLLVQESGGIVTDTHGGILDFGLGRTLGVNSGMIATGADTHATVLGAVQRALSEGNRQK